MCRVPAAPATQDIRRATRPHLKSPGPEFQGSGGEEQLQQHQLSRSGAVTSDQQLIGNIKTSHRLGIFISGGLCFEDDKDHDFLFPMVKTSLLLFLCLRLFSTLVGSSAAKLMMAALPPTQARTCQNFTNSLTWPVRNSRESTKANTTKIYLRKFCRQSNQRAGLGNNLCSNKHQSRDCCCDKESYEICIAARRVLNPLFRAWHQAYYTMRVFRFWQKSF